MFQDCENTVSGLFSTFVIRGVLEVGPWRFPFQHIRIEQLLVDIILLQDSRRKGPHFLGGSAGSFHKFSFDTQFNRSVTWHRDTIQMP